MPDVLVALALLLVANGAPVLATRILDERIALPLDGGLRLPDGARLLGPNKTLRGALAAVLASTLAAPLLGLTPGLGALVGIGAMTGDALSSFLKRRRGLGAGDRATLLDQLPEAFFPLLILWAAERLSVGGAALALVAFVILGGTISRVLYELGIRRRPY